MYEWGSENQELVIRVQYFANKGQDGNGVWAVHASGRSLSTWIQGLKIIACLDFGLDFV
jgi:hypothetical protein